MKKHFMERNNQMYCPLCKEPLINSGSFCYEDCCQSTIYTTEWSCSNENCICNQSKSYWNDDGDFFSGDMKNSYEIFKDHKYAALNSFAKRMEVDVYKKGLKSKIYLSPLLHLVG